jgi:hypothetical protein
MRPCLTLSEPIAAGKDDGGGALVLLLARGVDLAVTVGIGGRGDQMAAGPSRR